MGRWRARTVSETHAHTPETNSLINACGHTLPLGIHAVELHIFSPRDMSKLELTLTKQSHDRDLTN